MGTFQIIVMFVIMDPRNTSLGFLQSSSVSNKCGFIEDLFYGSLQIWAHEI